MNRTLRRWRCTDCPETLRVAYLGGWYVLQVADLSGRSYTSIGLPASHLDTAEADLARAVAWHKADSGHGAAA